MFVSQDDDAQLRAWRVFDPVGRGKLSIVEFKAALKICGGAIPAEAIEAEFRAINADGSGWVEAKEFARLLGRMASSRAWSAAPTALARRGLLGKLHDEALLFATVDSGTRQALPLAYHPLAGRLIANMKLFGFTWRRRLRLSARSCCTTRRRRRRRRQRRRAPMRSGCAPRCSASLRR